MAREARRIPAAQPDAEPICLLTREEAMPRRARPDVFFDRAEWRSADDGYEARLPATDDEWALANAFVEEEAACCPFFAFDLREEDGVIIIRAARQSGTA